MTFSAQPFICTHTGSVAHHRKVSEQLLNGTSPHYWPISAINGGQ